MTAPSYFEFGGGLGDVLHQCCYRGRYSNLLRVESARIAIISHNPACGELFRWHPRADRFHVQELGYWLPEQDSEMRRLHGLPVIQEAMPERVGPVVFYPSPQDQPLLLAARCRPYVVIAASAGEPERSLPADLAASLIRRVEAAGFLPVLVGRSYARNGRSEMLADWHDGKSVNYIDKLSVPGTAELLRRAAGLVTCHSAMNLLGWHFRAPQLLLYPESVLRRHFLKPDQWSFGAAFLETFRACLEDTGAVKKAQDGFFEWLRFRARVDHW